MNMTVLFKKYTYGLLLIATTLIGFAFNFTSATNTTFNCKTSNSFTIPSDGYLILTKYGKDTSYVEINLIDNNQNQKSKYVISNGLYLQNLDENDDYGLQLLSAGTYKFNNSQSSANYCELTFIPYNSGNSGNSGNSCNPNGECTVSDKVSENILFNGSKNFSSAGYTNMFNYGTEGAGTYCVKFTSSNAQQLTMGFANGGTTAPSNLYTLYADQYGNTICLYGNKPYFNIKLNASSNTIDYEIYKLTDLLSDDIPCTQQNCQTCEEQYTSSECQEEYDLIPIEDIDQTYCINANLCPILQESGDVQWSALYINNVQHLGNDIININIPEEIERDYFYNSGETNVEIIGYGYDQEKMQSMVNTQFTPPTSEDLENVIGKIADFLPLLAIGLLFVWTWYIIKKVFRKGF